MSEQFQEVPEKPKRSRKSPRFMAFSLADRGSEQVWVPLVTKSSKQACVKAIEQGTFSDGKYMVVCVHDEFELVSEQKREVRLVR